VDYVSSLLVANTLKNPFNLKRPGLLNHSLVAQPP
jgi:hypothetical protein